MIVTTFLLTMNQFILSLDVVSAVPLIPIMVGLTIPLFITTTCIYGQDMGEICKLYFLLDNIFVAYLTSISGIIGLMIILA